VTTNTDTDTDHDAYTEQLLEEYDVLRRRMLVLEPELRTACAAYGRRRGYWGYRPEHLRIALATTKRQSGVAGA
jgi:hypothetical protein